MIVSYFKRMFRPRRTDDARNPVHRIWIGGEEEAVLIDLASGKLHAHIWHDGYAKFYPTVYVSLFRGILMSLRHDGWLVSLLPLPRCILEVYRLRSMADAQGCVERVLRDIF